MENEMSEQNPLLELSKALGDISYDRDVALMENERLQAENTTLRAIVDALAAKDESEVSASDDYGSTECIFCDVDWVAGESHKADCLWIRARAITGVTQTTHSEGENTNDGQ